MPPRASDAAPSARDASIAGKITDTLIVPTLSFNNYNKYTSGTSKRKSM